MPSTSSGPTSSSSAASAETSTPGSESLNGGFQVAFAVGAVFAAAAAAIGGAYLRPKPMVVPDAEAGDEVTVPVH